MKQDKSLLSQVVSPWVIAGAALGLALIPVNVQAQQIINPNPAIAADDVDPTTPISASFKTTDGVSVDASSVKVFVNDRDVTSESVITSDFFSYRPANPLSSGRHAVLLEFKNSRGVLRRVTWSFNVGVPVQANIDSVVHNAGNRPLAAGEILLATVTGTPSSSVRIFLVQDGQQLQSLVTEEVSPGTYVSNVLVEAKDSTKEGIVVARLEHQGQVRFATAEQAVQLIEGADSTPQTLTTQEIGDTSTSTSTSVSINELTPRFTSHQDGQTISTSEFTLRGTTRPNASVRIEVTAERSIGGIISATNTVADRTVQADASGNFSLTVRPGAPVAGTIYNVRSQATSGNETSSRVVLQLTQQ